MLELCEKNTNINGLSLSLSALRKNKTLSEEVESILCVRWVMVMGDIIPPVLTLNMTG